MESIDLKTHLKNFEVLPVEEIPSLVPQKVKVSVCIMTYNQKEFIEECINSILRQETTFSFEIIIGEDESNDGTREICLAYAKKYPEKIRLLLHKRANNIKINDKPTGRFNFLYNLLHARGEFIALCEADDFWTDNFKLTKQVQLLENNPQCTGCFHDFQINYVGNSRSRIQKYRGIKQFDLEYFLKKNPYIATASLVFKKSILRNVPNSITKLFAADFLLKYIILLSGNFVHVDSVMSAYNKGTEGSWTSIKKDQKRIDVEFLDNISALLEVNTLTEHKHQVVVLHKINDIVKRYRRRSVALMNYKQQAVMVFKNPKLLDLKFLRLFLKRFVLKDR